MTASQARAPFFVAPNDRTSIPAFQLISAGVQPRETRALAKRAIHMHHEAGIMGEGAELGKLAAAVDRAAFGDLRKRQSGGLDAFFHAARKIRECRLEIGWRDLACRARNPNELGAAGEHLRRATLVFHDMGVSMTE